MLNLIKDPWIPVLTRGGERRVIRPADLSVDAGTDREPLRPAWPRPDFDVATWEFLIGLAFVALAPRRTREWARRYDDPPSPGELHDALAPFAPAFEISGDGPRFLQDLEAFETGTPSPIERLLIDAAGGSAVKKNADLMVHRDRYAAFDPPTAAIALYALQQFAPAGGAGNRTSMRGGGALTVLVLPKSDLEPSLWQVVWANTPLAKESRPEPDDPRAFPWLAPTRISDGGRETFPSDAHEAQAFFGMPRRLRLVFEENTAIGFHQKPRGVNYANWLHPLSPHYRQKDDAPLLPRHLPAGRIGYRDWAAATALPKDNPRQQAAQSVTAWVRERRRSLGQAMSPPQVMIAGWSMNNMEAQDFHLVIRPLHLSEDPEQQAALDELALSMAAAGDAAWAATGRAITRALLDPDARSAGDGALLADARQAFYARTESDFHRVLAGAVGDPTGDGPRRDWLGVLQAVADGLFNEWVRLRLADPGRDGARAVTARRHLLADLHGRSRAAPLHKALTLPVPESRDATGASREASA